MRSPVPRGPVSRAVLATLAGAATPLPRKLISAAWCDDDFQLALWSCYELSYSGFDDVDDAREWDPSGYARPTTASLNPAGSCWCCPSRRPSSPA
jgi:hypothetical protein